ncbi:hypothetical protein ATX21_09460 [Oenococcus oeni]|uniref:ImmA/IrrE family metallo-endopeptidase n=1 Tax=Oenococcus oeni TaxID=1247 RepID=UPI0008F94571|nr:hypothetical protein [Oenococcus oeni]OIL54640.1 hypothetical protein ATX21_09460 [Oenococcus oeni]OIL57881.1 hypothetical protein ATX22_02415 [Oenococcus oeni]
MNPIEKIESDYPEYKVYLKTFPDEIKFMHGFVNRGLIFIDNELPIDTQAEVLMHEIIHLQYDTGQNLCNHNSVKVLRAEYFANKWAEKDSKKYL